MPIIYALTRTQKKTLKIMKINQNFKSFGTFPRVGHHKMMHNLEKMGLVEFGWGPIDHFLQTQGWNLTLLGHEYANRQK